MRPDLTIVVPTYNQAELVLPFYYDLIKHIPENFELVWINDGSTDTTLEEIEALSLKDERIFCITLKKRFGNEAAVIAGLDYANGNLVIIMSGDLQHPSRYISEITEELNKGNDIVNTIQTNSAPLLGIQKAALNPYYQFLNFLSKKDCISDLTEFRGFKRQVIEDILFMKEKHFFSGYFFNWSDYKISSVYYENNRCKKENKKYTIQHLVKSTLTAFKSNTPGILKFFVIAGGGLCFFSLLSFALFLIAFFKGNPVPGSYLFITGLVFIGGLQLFIFSSYKRKLKQDLYHFGKVHQYLIQNILEPNQYIPDFKGSAKSSVSQS